MAPDASASDRLTELLQQQSERAKQYASEIPLLRAAAHATSDRLTRLAATPPGVSPPQQAYVDIVFEAPSRAWAEDLAVRLGSQLPNVQVNLGPSDTALQDAPVPGYVIRCEVSWRDQAPLDAKEAVMRALADMGDVEVNYNEPIDLVVVAPRDHLETRAPEVSPLASFGGQRFAGMRPPSRISSTQQQSCEHGNLPASCPRCRGGAGVGRAHVS